MAKDKTETLEPPPGSGATAPAVSQAATMTADAMAQVRELLFGETKRTTDERLRAIENRIEALHNEMLEHVMDLQTRLDTLARDTEHSQAATVDAIGGAIAQLGATVQNMSLKRKGA